MRDSLKATDDFIDTANPQDDSIKCFCPKCGFIPAEKINIYNEALKKQKINILPILPTCQLCGSEIDFGKKLLSGRPQKVIALTGTCASGKTATAEMLINQHGFYGIDGDSAMNVVKHKLGITKFDFNGIEMFDEITHQIDILLLLNKDIVISHVIMPGDIPKFREIFQSRNLNYKIFLLQPKYSTALCRSKTRTCFNNITPEEWVRYFYDKLSAFEQQMNNDVVILDNSDFSVEESACKIMQIFNESYLGG